MAWACTSSPSPVGRHAPTTSSGTAAAARPVHRHLNTGCAIETIVEAGLSMWGERLQAREGEGR